MSHPQKRFKLTLHYDGSAFHGWQVQPGKPTVQGQLQRAASQLAASPRTVTGAGRTDSGVHATGQVASVDMPDSWSAPPLARSLNALLPNSVWVADAEAVSASFHPRYDATSRSYSYRVGIASGTKSPFLSRWCWPLCEVLDLDAATQAANALPGSHQFRAFTKSGQPERGYDCRIFTATWAHWHDLGVVFEVSASRFLHRMVRYLVGTMIDVARGRREPEEIGTMLREDSSLTTSPPAPASGLFLTGVGYAEGKHDGTGRELGAARAGMTPRAGKQ